VATIELGELADADAPVPPEMSGRARRVLLCALVAVATVLALSGSAPARPGLGAPIWSGEVSLAGFNLGPRSVYLSEPTGRVVLAREQPTGALRWRLEIDSLPMGTLDAGGGVAAVQSRIPAPGGRGETLVMLVREATGEVIASTHGNVIGPSTTGHQLIVIRQDELASNACPTYGYPCLDVYAIDTTNGREVHRLAMPGGTGFAVSYVDSAVAGYTVFDQEGHVTVYDAGSGDVVDRVTVARGDTIGLVRLTQDRMFTVRRDGDLVRVDGFRRDPLSPLWTTSLPTTDNPEYPVWWLSGDDCGTALCVHGANGTTLLDQETGALRFVFDGEIAGALSDGSLVGYRMAYTPNPVAEAPRDMLILDPLTGAVRGTVPRATVIGWGDARGRLLLAQSGVAGSGATRTGFVLVEADGRLRQLGSVDGVGLNCQARADVLACADPSGLLRVWTLPVLRPGR
jgi:hypothetical protein